MPYHFNTPEDTQSMLDAIGVDSVESLFDCIPKDLQLDRPLDLPAAKSELELAQHMGAMADRNLHAQNSVCFLGGGSYDHFIPAVVDALASRGEFYTSYTPYQPEVSQGNLQAMFEYQTLICQLTGMDVSNASLYDGGSAVTEAALMALSVARGRDAMLSSPRINASRVPSDPGNVSRKHRCKHGVRSLSGTVVADIDSFEQADHGHDCLRDCTSNPTSLAARKISPSWPRLAHDRKGAALIVASSIPSAWAC